MCVCVCVCVWVCVGKKVKCISGIRCLIEFPSCDAYSQEFLLVSFLVVDNEYILFRVNAFIYYKRWSIQKEKMLGMLIVLLTTNKFNF